MASSAGFSSTQGPSSAPAVAPPRYPFAASSTRSLEDSFPPPPGFSRVPAQPGSFAAWLRRLPLRPPGTPVRAFDGSLILAGDDPRLSAVVAIDTGHQDLQQCADSILRLHAEWSWSTGRAATLGYRFTSGHLSRWRDWADGLRPRVEGSAVRFRPEAPRDASRASFRAWLDSVFTYAGTLSLERDLLKPRPGELQPGDLFVAGGSPGHAVVLLDIAARPDGARVALVGQGFTPAQDLHVLRSPEGPWFPLLEGGVQTPFWAPFPANSARSFPP